MLRLAKRRPLHRWRHVKDEHDALLGWFAAGGNIFGQSWLTPTLMPTNVATTPIAAEIRAANDLGIQSFAMRAS